MYGQWFTLDLMVKEGDGVFFRFTVAPMNREFISRILINYIFPCLFFLS
jgi:hypothetical protein